MIFDYHVLDNGTHSLYNVSPRTMGSKLGEWVGGFCFNWWQEESTIVLKAYAPLRRSGTEKKQVGNLPVEVGNLPRGVEKKD